MKDIVIVGAGGFSKEVAFLIEDINKANLEWNLLGYVDEEVGSMNGKYTVVGNDEWLLNYDKPLHVVIGIGSTKIISKISENLKSNTLLKFPNLIHPNVVLDEEGVKFGEGNIICAGNIFTTDIEIGSFNIINLNCTIGHDSLIGSNNIFNPNVNVSGGANIGTDCFFGTSSTILQYINIGDNTIIGANGLVIKDLTEPGVYVGVPVKKK